MKHTYIHSALLVTVLLLSKKCLPYIYSEFALSYFKNTIPCPIAAGLIKKSIPKEACILVDMLNVISFPQFSILYKSRLSILRAAYHFYSIENCCFKYCWLDGVKIEEEMRVPNKLPTSKWPEVEK